MASLDMIEAGELTFTTFRIKKPWYWWIIPFVPWLRTRQEFTIEYEFTFKPAVKEEQHVDKTEDRRASISRQKGQSGCD